MSVVNGRIEQRPWFGAADSGLDLDTYKVIVVLIFARRVVVFSRSCIAAYPFQYRDGFFESVACSVALFLAA